MKERTNQSAQNNASFINKIVNFFKNLFGGQKKKTIPKEPDTSESYEQKPNSSEFEFVIGDSNNTSPPSSEQEHLNSAVIKYGDGEITLTKNKEYVAIKRSAQVREMLEEGTSNDTNPNDFGGFDLIGPIGENKGKSRAVTAPNGTTEETLDELRGMPNIEVGTHVFQSSDGGDLLIPSGEIYVVFHNHTNPQECLDFIHFLKLHILEKRSHTEYILAATIESSNPIKATVMLQNSPLVSLAEPELISKPGFFFQIPSDDLLKNQWHLENKGKHGNWPTNSFKAGADAKVVAAWKYMKSLGSKNIVVAVVDSGFDIDHPDLRGDGRKVVAPWDFETDTSNPRPKLGDWHGTSCAGIAIGAANHRGIVGAAPNAKFMPMRFSYISDTQIEKWFQHAADNGADIISNSWGSRDPNFVMSTRMINAISRAAKQGRNGKGCVIVFAAGNTSRSITHSKHKVSGFATHPDVIAVSASNSKDERSSYSNFGKEISICAPSNGSGGAGVTTADVSGTLRLPSGATGFKGYNEGDYTTSFGGTSSACPLVAGICALILSVKPNLAAKQVKNILETTADKIGKAHEYKGGHSKYYGHGRINALKAVKMAQTGNIPVDIRPAEPTPAPPLRTKPAPNPSPSVPPLVPEPMPTQIISIPFEGWRGGALLRTGMEHVFKINISQKLTVQISVPEGNADLDLYLKRGRKPHPKQGDYDKSSAQEGSNEKLTVYNPPPDDYYVMVQSYQGSGGFNFEASLNATTSNTAIEALSLRASIGGIIVRERYPAIVYKMGTKRKLVCQLDSPVGDKDRNFDIYVKRGRIPRWNDYDGRGISQRNREYIELNNPQPGEYYVLVRSQKGRGGYTIRVALV